MPIRHLFVLVARSFSSIDATLVLHGIMVGKVRAGREVMDVSRLHGAMQGVSTLQGYEQLERRRKRRLESLWKTPGTCFVDDPSWCYLRPECVVLKAA